jgi:hypothetical protein
MLRGTLKHKRLIINPIIKRFGVKKGIYTEGGLNNKINNILIQVLSKRINLNPFYGKSNKLFSSIWTPQYPTNRLAKIQSERNAP